MADVDQETHFLLIHLLLVFLHGPFQLVFFPFQCSPEHLDYDAGGEQGTPQCEPPGTVPGREYGQFQYLLTGNPAAVFGRAGSHNLIIARWERADDQFRIVRFDLLIVQSFYLIPVHFLPENILFL